MQSRQRQTDSLFLLDYIHRHTASVLGVSRELAGQRTEVQINRERRTRSILEAEPGREKGLFAHSFVFNVVFVKLWEAGRESQLRLLTAVHLGFGDRVSCSSPGKSGWLASYPQGSARLVIHVLPPLTHT